MKNYTIATIVAFALVLSMGRFAAAETDSTKGPHLAANAQGKGGSGSAAPTGASGGEEAA